MSNQAHLIRYSPANGFAVVWGFNGVAFSDSCLPKGRPCTPDVYRQIECCGGKLPLVELPDTYTWDRWLPEVLIGIEDYDEEVAAAYVREAAIKFCKTSRVLQRRVAIRTQCDTYTYPVEPIAGERITNVLLAIYPDRCDCACSALTDANSFAVLDPRRSEIHFKPPKGKRLENGVVELIVSVAPTEDACEHDVYLYDAYREEITAEARYRYAVANHFRDRVLLSSLHNPQQFELDIQRARRESTKWLKPPLRSMPSNLFG